MQAWRTLSQFVPTEQLGPATVTLAADRGWLTFTRRPTH
jgi:hypothetical protein